MEKQNNKICSGLLNNCMMAMQTEKKITKKEKSVNENLIIVPEKDKQQPWSVFGENYWI